MCEWDLSICLYAACKLSLHPSQGIFAQTVSENSIIYHLQLNIGQQGKWLKESVMQGAIICSQATLLFVLKIEKWRGKGEREETKETNGPISFLKRCFSSSFIKSRRRILFDWLITRSIHHWPMYPHQSDVAILDNLLRMTKRSLLLWLIFDLFNIRKLIFSPKQTY